jgi:predicted metal-dependent hydrolase
VDIDIIRKQVSFMRLRLLPDGTLRVTAPPDVDVSTFIERKSAWIEKKQQELQKIAEETSGTESLLLLNGQYHHLIHGDCCNLGIYDHTVTYTTPSRLKKYLSTTLREELLDSVAHHALDMGVTYQDISVRMQKTKWASCSGRGRLSFNLFTYALPEALRDYIVVHELAHLDHFDHSKRFWQKVCCYYPRYLEAERDLKKYWVIIQRNQCWKTLRDMADWESTFRDQKPGENRI